MVSGSPGDTGDSRGNTATVNDCVTVACSSACDAPYSSVVAVRFDGGEPTGCDQSLGHGERARSIPDGPRSAPANVPHADCRSVVVVDDPAQQPFDWRGFVIGWRDDWLQ
jgi:hypothetical protein